MVIESGGGEILLTNPEHFWGPRSVSVQWASGPLQG